MKKIIFILILVVVATRMNAQDVVYLKNGSVIKGAIVEHMLNDHVKIETADGSLWVFNMDEVERMTFNRSKQNTDEGVYAFHNDNYLKKGFRGFVDLGVDLGIRDAIDYNMLSASFTGGYQLNRFLFVGAGIAPSIGIVDDNYWYWEDYRSYSNRDTGFILPLYGAVRFDFVNAKISPFVDMRVGYSVTDYCRGGYVYLGTGCRFKRWSFATGYTYQDNDGFDMGFVSFKAGFEF